MTRDIQVHSFGDVSEVLGEMEMQLEEMAEANVSANAVCFDTALNNEESVRIIKSVVRRMDKLSSGIRKRMAKVETHFDRYSDLEARVKALESKICKY